MLSGSFYKAKIYTTIKNIEIEIKVGNSAPVLSGVATVFFLEMLWRNENNKTLRFKNCWNTGNNILNGLLTHHLILFI